MKYLYASAANLLALPLLPLLIGQGRHTRRTTPRLPEAQGARSGLIHPPREGRRLRLLAIGESPVAGVGVERQQQAITACFAQALAESQACAVEWQACGQNGATVAEALHTLVPQIPQQEADIALIAFGVNDTSAFRPLHRFARDLHNLAQAVQERSRARLLLISAVPPVGSLRALPQPLRLILGLKASALNAVSQEVARDLQQALATRTQVMHAHITLGHEQHEARDMLAADGYHPSAKACRLWGQSLAEQCAPLLTSWRAAD